MDPQIDKQRPREQDTATRETTSEEIICREQTGRILWVTERDVDEHALEDDEHRASVDDDTDGRGDPVNGCARCPGEEEEPDGSPEDVVECGDETGFLCAQAVSFDVRDEVVVHVQAVDGYAGAAGDQDAEEDDADFAEVEAVVDRVDEGEDLEETGLC